MAYDRQAMRIVTPGHFSRLERWAQRKPCVALMGEFSAGKSTLLNFLIEEDLLPTRATATELSPVWFSYGDRPCYWEDARGEIHALDPKDLYGVPRSARYIRVFSQAEILEHCDVIDTPGISDPNLAVDSWRFAVGVCNMVLWCSSATQAWRESERAAWASLPERLRRHSLLIVTRADKLVASGDKEKVDRRLGRETAGFFADRVFLATPNAVQAKLDMVEGGSSPLWEASGAADLLDRLAERFEGVYEDRAGLLARYATEAMVAEAAEPQIVPARVRPVEPATARPRPEDVDTDFLATLPSAAGMATDFGHGQEDALPAAADGAEDPFTVAEAAEAAHHDEIQAPGTGEAATAEAGWADLSATGEPHLEAVSDEGRGEGQEASEEAAAEAGGGAAPNEINVLHMPLRPVRPPSEERPRKERPSAAEAEELRAALGVGLAVEDDAAAEDEVSSADPWDHGAQAGDDAAELAAVEAEPVGTPDLGDASEEPFSAFDTASEDAETGAGTEAVGPEEPAADAWAKEPAAEAEADAEEHAEAWTGEPSEHPEIAAGHGKVTLEEVLSAEAPGLQEVLADDGEMDWTAEESDGDARTESGIRAVEDQATDDDALVSGPAAEEAGPSGETEALAEAEAEPAPFWAAEDVTPMAAHDEATFAAGPASAEEPSEALAGGADMEGEVWAVGDFAPPDFVPDEADLAAEAAEADISAAEAFAEGAVEDAAETDEDAAVVISQDTLAALHDEATMQAVEEAMGEEDLSRTLLLTAEHSVGEVVDAAAQVPHEVLVWRDIVARHEVDPANAQMVAMFDEFLTALYGTDRDGAAATGDAGPAERHGAGGWRRLA